MNLNLNKIPVIDLFAGPGGLGEGFASLKQDDGSNAFQSVVSIERDNSAHQTLHLRHFLRAFPDGKFPDEYYKYLSGKISKKSLYDKFRKQKIHADESALKISLGDENADIVHRIIKEKINGSKAWALVGGPPCQAYSLVGRSRMKHDPEFSNDKRHFLNKEYLNIIADHAPPVFVMENVKGLLSSKVGDEFVADDKKSKTCFCRLPYVNKLIFYGDSVFFYSEKYPYIYNEGKDTGVAGEGTFEIIKNKSPLYWV